jgi:hypothetical protein
MNSTSQSINQAIVQLIISVNCSSFFIFQNVDVVSLWDILQVIMKDGEEILAVRMTVLNAQLQKLAFAHAARFHEDRKQKLTLILDSERWTSAEIPVEFQSFVDRIFAQQTFLVALPRQKYDESVNAEAGDTRYFLSNQIKINIFLKHLIQILNFSIKKLEFLF